MRTVFLMLPLFLSACAVGYSNNDIRRASTLPGSDDILATGISECTQAKPHDCIHKNVDLTSELDYLHKRGKTTGDNTIGLSLAGGGSKSAPFALGVLQEFVLNGWIQQTDYISSVSGGGYAALYLYSSALKNLNKPEPSAKLADFFADEKPTIWYDPSKDPAISDNPEVFGKLIGTKYYKPSATPKRDTDRDLIMSHACSLSPKDYDHERPNLGNNKYLAWVDCYQDILSSWPGGFSTNAAKWVPAWKASTLVAGSMLTAPIHYFENILFDWRQRASISQHAYIRGIYRTYAFDPEKESNLPISIWSPEVEEQMTGMTFLKIRSLYEQTNMAKSGLLPIWIINATGNSGNVAFDLSNSPYDLDQAIFEFTPFGYGSGRYGYVAGDAGRLGVTVPDAVLAASAFFDTAQRKFNRPIINSILNVFNVRWGLDIPNYRVPDSKRVTHSLLPWPIYYLDEDAKSPSGPTIHLSDGGQSGDNLGIVSLLKRNIKHIVVAAGEQDFEKSGERSGYMTMSSLCAVNRYLKKTGEKLVFDGNPNDGSSENKTVFDLSKKCATDRIGLEWINPETKDTGIYPLKWKWPVWKGTVVNISSSGPSGECGEHACSNIYYLMSGLDQNDWLAASKYLKKWPGPGRDPLPDCIGDVIIKGTRYNCAVLHYVGIQLANDYWQWPQTTTAGTTYNSSANLARGYRNLGRHAASFLVESGLFQAPPDRGITRIVE